MPLLNVDEARAAILTSIVPLAPEQVPLAHALGRTLAQDVIADRDVPSFPNSAMDGYAFRACDTGIAAPAHPVTLHVIGTAAAGSPLPIALQAGEAIRIMTGAPIPAGADAVIPFEEVHADATWVRIGASIRPGTNIRDAGEDMQCGQKIIRAGTRLAIGEIGVLAALGCAQLLVYRCPRVGIVATGDEVIPIGRRLEPGQIYDANSAILAAQIRQAGGIPVPFGTAPDTERALHAVLARIETVDFMVSSGGISAGDFDTVKAVLATHGMIAFWKVNVKPGKPVAFGIVRNVPFLGLPGNPVAAMVNFELFGWPALQKLQGNLSPHRPRIRVEMQDGLIGKPGKRTYVRAHVRWIGERFIATTTGRQESHLVTSLLGANALVIVPESQGGFQSGDLLDAELFDTPSTE